MSKPPPTGDWPAPAAAVPADRPTVPGYEILEELGRGGMGVVYKARHVKLDRLVALKLLRDGALAGPQERARLVIEARAAARLRHPNIVQIYEVSEHAGAPYIAMELVEDGRLDTYLAGRPQPARQAAELVRALALAVQHAHEQNVVHRDLKPGNILLQEADKETRRQGDKEKEVSAGICPGIADQPAGEHGPDPLSLSPCLPVSLSPKIADFGLAKLLDSESTAWTREGAVLGTASYMAPEQAAGRVQQIGPAVDVYALGAILYELLTGRPPFQADSWNEILQQVLYDEPAPPTRWHADVPRDLETICLKCLEKDPGRRYASALELADDLGRFLETRPVAAVPLSEQERLARLARRDGYHIIGEIGRGPRSIVYHARYEPLQQPVALKVFPAGACTRDEWEERFRRSADLWAALAHPHIVPVHRAGWWDDAPYLAVEYVPHGSLAGRLTGQSPHGRRGPDVKEALRLVEQLTDIVRYLHRQGVVHGNLKPSNVLFAADGIPRVVDFRLTGGLFQGPLPADDADPAGLGYLPPESARDPGAEPRPYTDVYGLGLILYELLTGRPAFAGATARETLEQVREHDPVPPSHLNPDVTPHLEAFCLRCLRKNPWRRYARVHDLFTRLRSFQDDQENLVAPEKQRSRQSPPGRADDPSVV
jgi:serine/threonine protein kinase